MPRVLGLGGYKESGKDEFAKELEARGWLRLGMSDDLHGWLMIQNPIVQAVAQFDAQGHYKSILTERYADVINRYGYDLAKAMVNEVREQQKKVGTECGRNMFGEDVWTSRVSSKIIEALHNGQSVVVTGIRYPNELDMIELFSDSGYTAWVDRPGVEGRADAHSSEQSLGPDDFMQILNNHGTLEDWKAQVPVWLETYGG